VFLLLETIVNLMYAGMIIFLICVWIHGLVNWDGKNHCRPEDCDRCPYEGTGCTPGEAKEKSNDERKKKL